MSWTAVATALGTLAAGLALPMAVYQLAALREDRLRAQISQVGVWMETTIEEAPQAWQGPMGPPRTEIALCIRNSSQLPVDVYSVKLVTGLVLHPRDIAPDYTWTRRLDPDQVAEFASFTTGRVTAMSVMDAARNLWDMRPAEVGRPRRIRARRWWEWRHGTKTPP